MLHRFSPNGFIIGFAAKSPFVTRSQFCDHLDQASLAG
uniref:Uncharacterized protein n=1 Tax=Rhizobium rhizogenes TaxID=359 RepID=A0A7S4ZUS0_RHIRH|nr:hypothetical protein pC5.8d_730 [Rhizobium rhizogenes]